MDDIMLMEYLRSKGIEDMSEHEFVSKFKDFMHKYGKTSYMRYPEDDYEDDYPMYDMKYRRGMGMRKHQDYESPYMNDLNIHYKKYGKPYGGIHRMYDDYPESNIMYSMQEHHKTHFDESHAKHIVSNMYHTENGKTHSGEKFSMMKAKEVQDRYRGMLSTDITLADIYVAINAQYHDYCELFKSWFGGNIESKIIESAIVFWFKDTDYDKGFKLTEYFKEN